MRKREERSGRGAHLNEVDTALFVDALRLQTVEQLPVDMRQHVAGCHKCKREVTSLFALLQEEELPRIDSHPYFTLTSRRRVWVSVPALRVAAAVAAIAGLTALTYYVGSMMSSPAPSRMSEGRRPTQADSGGRVADSTTLMRDTRRGALAADLTPNADLEDLVNSQSRSESVEVIAPVNGAVINAGQVFRWNMAGGGPVNLSLIDNKGKIVLKARVSGESYELTRPFPPGLYYWKVQSESELLYVGKFFVRFTPPSKRTPPT